MLGGSLSSGRSPVTSSSLPSPCPLEQASRSRHQLPPSLGRSSHLVTSGDSAPSLSSLLRLPGPPARTQGPVQSQGRRQVP